MSISLQKCYFIDMYILKRLESSRAMAQDSMILKTIILFSVNCSGISATYFGGDIIFTQCT